MRGYGDSKGLRTSLHSMTQSVDRQTSITSIRMRRAVQGERGRGEEGTGRASPCISCLQLFRRVASALPGMENVQEKSKEGSILFLWHVSEKTAPKSMFRLVLH